MNVIRLGYRNLMVVIGRSGAASVEGLLSLHHRAAARGGEGNERGLWAIRKQPAFAIVDDTDIRRRPKALIHCILDDVLAIDGRGRSCRRRVSMERAELAKQRSSSFARMIGSAVVSSG